MMVYFCLVGFYVHVVGEVVLGDAAAWEVWDRWCLLLENNVWDFDFIGEAIVSVIDMNVESWDEFLFAKFLFWGEIILDSDGF